MRIVTGGKCHRGHPIKIRLIEACFGDVGGAAMKTRKRRRCGVVSISPTNWKSRCEMKYEGRGLLTHRLSAFASGIIDNLEPAPNNVVLHLCNNPKCCRPDHLKRGTQSENMRQQARDRFCADNCAVNGRQEIPKKSNNLKTNNKKWSERQDSNLRPPRPER